MFKALFIPPLRPARAPSAGWVPGGTSVIRSGVCVARATNESTVQFCPLTSVSLIRVSVDAVL